MEIRIPEEAQWILEQLNEHGFEAFVVGGCVRDCLLGREPGDWDITTDARPEEVKDIFRRTIDTGILHGTVTVMVEHTGYEVTTYRIDGEYEDGRHPKEVEFTSNLIEDLKRRDFTINAMAYSRRDGLVDAFDGMGDLSRGIIRCVGSPVDRFTEDALRILRAVRFSAQLGFAIEKETRDGIAFLAPNLQKVSKERIAVELTKLLLSDHTDRMELAYELGIGPYISDAFSQASCLGARDGSLNRLPLLSVRKHMRWAGFLKAETPGAAADILRDLKMDNDTIDRVKLLLSVWKVPVEPDRYAVRSAMSKLEPESFDDLLEFQEVMGDESLKPKLLEVKSLTEEIRKAGDCVSLKQLAVTGKDLIAAGMQPGPELGDVLSGLFEKVLVNPELNEKEILLSLISRGSDLS